MKDRCACCGDFTKNYLCSVCADAWYEKPAREREERRRRESERRRELEEEIELLDEEIV